MKKEYEARLADCKGSVLNVLDYTLRGLTNKNDSDSGKKEVIFPLHNSYHSERVELKLRQFISIHNEHVSDENKICELSEFILYCCAWLHDIGCLISRKNHAMLSAKIITQHKGTIQGIAGYEEIIALLCSAHSFNGTDDPISQLNETVIVHDGIEINMHMMAALLRLADACDIDARKAPKIVYDILSEIMDPESEKFWSAHENIQSCWPKDNKILITFKQHKDNDKFIMEYLEKDIVSSLFWLKKYDFPITGYGYEYVRPDSSYWEELNEPLGRS